MRVALSCPYAWDAPGGVQVHVRELAARLRDRGHKVLVLAPASSRPIDPDVISVGRPVPVPFNGSVAPIAPSPAASHRVRQALEDFRPDVVHAHEPLAPSVSMFATRWARVPVVATFHAYADRAITFTLLAPALRRVWKRLALRIAVSEAAASFVSRRFSEDGIRVIPNGVDVERFGVAKPADLPEGRKLLFVNRLEPRKGFSVMVDAFGLLASSYHDVLLIVAGEGKERVALGRLARKVRDRVLMLGSVPHELVPPYHAASDVFCAPSTGRESFGIVLVEAMAAGLPIVASDIPGYREVVRRNTDGLLVPPGRPDALAASVATLLDDPGLAGRYANAGRARARRYSWDVVAREVEMTYEEAVAGGPGGSRAARG
ncbi:MAG: glycosyltransferase family 4 protein [Actinomycetota bacterium]